VRVDKRHEDVKVEGNKYIELDPEIAELFRASKSVSTSNGKAFHLFKANASRRRSKKEIEEAKLQEATKKVEVEMRLNRLTEMEQQVGQMQEQIQNQQRMMDQAQMLYDQGLLK
jgi:hypothetical protein